MLQAKHIFWLPNCIFGGISIAAALLTLFLPETMGKPVVRNLDDVYMVFYSMERNK